MVRSDAALRSAGASQGVEPERSVAATPLASSEALLRLRKFRESLQWLDPLDAYARLRAAGHVAFLLEGAGLHPEARFSYVALTPVRHIKVEGPFVTETGPEGSTETRDNVLGHLHEALASFRFPDSVGHEGFTGGWVGYFGYEFSRHLEPVLPGRKSDPGMPDARLALCLDAIVFDRVAGTATLHCADLHEHPANGFGDAKARLAAIHHALARGTILPKPAATSINWEASLSQDQFMLAVAQLKRRIHDGDLFQANLATRFSAPCTTEPMALFSALRLANPAPYMALLEFDEGTIVSASPEQLFAAENGRIRSRPIAGTRKRGRDAAEDAALEQELLSDAKEQAEHTMLVDLVRNDIAKVSVSGTVAVPERMSVERYRHVMHLVSRVEGQVRPGTSFLDWFGALFPGGTVTGAPKVRACQRIHEEETVARGPYTGSAGTIAWNGDAHWSILIRTLVVLRGFAGDPPTAMVHAGSGIVADSGPEREWKEAGRKAQALLDAAQGRAMGGNATRLGEVTSHGSWAPPRTSRRADGKRVLLIDNFDSFVHNLADYCAALGAETKVIRNDVAWQPEVEKFRPTHVILSPGPGWPEASGATLDIARQLHGRLPLLGVCLGHQALGAAHGATVKVHPSGPVHGKADLVQHDGQGLFAGLPRPLLAARYHSLIVDPACLGTDWLIDARLADGTVMALRHKEHPTYGLQFHPESICTAAGLELLAHFLGEP